MEPRDAALVDLVAFGEPCRLAEVMIAAADARPDRTVFGTAAMIAYDPCAGRPYIVARLDTDPEPRRPIGTAYCVAGWLN